MATFSVRSHKFGQDVSAAASTQEALRLAGLDWSVEQWPLVAVQEGGQRLAVESHVVNVRSDTQVQLGVVGKGYAPIQNSELIELADAIQQEGSGEVSIEHAWSMFGGRKVVLCLRGRDFSIGRADDLVFPYLIVSNGHDGTTSLRCTPSTFRPFCSNQLNAIKARANQLGAAQLVLRHTRNIKERVQEAKRALEFHTAAIAQTQEAAALLASKGVNAAMVNKLFIDAYTHDFGAIPSEEKGVALTAQGQRAREKAITAYCAFAKRYTGEAEEYGANLWTAFNAYSGWIQHESGKQLRDKAKAVEVAAQSNLFGLNAERTLAAFTIALSMAG